MSKKSGFSIVELLVTISIIVILGMIAFVLYTRVLQTARDAKRESDLKLIQSALEQFYADQKYYPLIAASCTNGSFTFNCALKNSDGTKTYLNNLPSGPVNTAEYLYECSGPLCQKYCLYAKGEGVTSMLTTCPDQTNYTIEVTSP